MPLRLHVFSELLVVTHLRADAEIAALVGTRVYTQIPPEATYPLLRINRIGGVPQVRQHLDVARIQIDAWGDFVNENHAIANVNIVARTAQAALHTMVGVHDEGVVTAVRDDLGLTWAPDPDTNRARYVFGVAIYSRPST